MDIKLILKLLPIPVKMKKKNVFSKIGWNSVHKDRLNCYYNFNFPGFDKYVFQTIRDLNH